MTHFVLFKNQEDAIGKKVLRPNICKFDNAADERLLFIPEGTTDGETVTIIADGTFISYE